MTKKALPLLAAFTIAASSLVPLELAFAQGKPKSNQFWWPEIVDLGPLRQHGAESDPLGEDFDYASEFSKVDLAELKKDIEALMTTSTSQSLYLRIDTATGPVPPRGRI